MKTTPAQFRKLELVDGLQDLQKGISEYQANARFTTRLVSDAECNSIAKSGVGARIINLKTEWSLRNGLILPSQEQQDIYKKIETKIYEAVRSMLIYGRGIIVIDNGDETLEEEMTSINLNRTKFLSFSGAQYIVGIGNIDNNVRSENYYKPQEYYVRGMRVHHSRVIDFIYVRPDLIDAPNYQYGGISELEIIYTQLVADGIMENTIPAVIQKAAIMEYKHPEFNEHLQDGNEHIIIDYFKKMSEMAKAAGTIITDTETQTATHSLTIPNLADANQFSLQRLAMASGLAVSVLVSEAAKGLNATGEQEEIMTLATISSTQHKYIKPKIEELFRKIGVDDSGIEMRSAKEETPKQAVKREGKVLDNAIKMHNMGFETEAYLLKNGIEATMDAEAPDLDNEEE